MPKFEDSLSAFDLPEEVQEQLLGAYNEDFAGANSKVDQLTNVIGLKDTAYSELSQKYNEDTTALKAANYDAMRTGSNTTGSAASGGTVDDDESDADDITIDDLFSSIK